VSVRVLPAGDRALVVEFDDEISVEVNGRVRALEHLLAQRRIPGVTETVPSFRSLLVYYDPRALGHERLRASIAELLPQASASALPAPREVELPCCYSDPELGFELEAAAARLGVSSRELVRRHSEADYLVYFLGFAPGQPYMTEVPQQLAIPRLETPRTRTPAGSIGIGGTQCCIYSVESPGGFWVLGRTPVKVYDPAASEPVLLRPGDRVRFRSIGRDEYDRIVAAVDAGTYRAVIR